MSLKNFVGHEIYSSFNKILLGHDLYIYWCIIKITFLHDILSFMSGDVFNLFFWWKFLHWEDATINSPPTHAIHPIYNKELYIESEDEFDY